MDLEFLFKTLFTAKTETEVDEFIKSQPDVFIHGNWYPLGAIASNYGVVENQQSNPIAALIEKITNSIDAILTKRCWELGIDPKSSSAPRTMEAAVEAFFPDATNWDLAAPRRKQAESLQIIADGPRRDTSLIIYDDGEGQHPENFEDTFLSLLRGNKNEIHFVQGKYNMGGSGSIVFCGKKRFQLIASKRFDKSGNFGFTLVREHPLSDEEKITKKNTWYEFLKLDNVIPSFPIDQLHLGLSNRLFETGTVIKLFSYDLPSGVRSVISRDLNQSINEYLFKPALPILTVDTKERYSEDRGLVRALFGLKRRLEQDENKYVQESFSETYQDDLFGKKGAAKISCYVFNNKIQDKSVKETKDSIGNEFFKNNMAVLFSVNGQVQGHYTSEFITRSLKMNLLKNHLLIHVDCTSMDIDFRKELFMASRDRLKDGNETRELRDFLAKKLGSKEGRLFEIDKKKKDSLSVEESDTKDLIKSFTKNLPLNSDLLKLLGQTFKLDNKDENKKVNPPKPGSKDQIKTREPFKPERFPTFFSVKLPEKDGIKAIQLPQGSEKTIRFDTDVENSYFDRLDEPGEIRVALISYASNETDGGTEKGNRTEIQEVMNVHTSSPRDGTIRLGLNPKTNTKVGDEIQIKVTLTGPGKEFEELFWAKITDPEKPKEDALKPKPEEELMGLPELVLLYKEQRDEKSITWEKFQESIGEEMNIKRVMFPQAAGDALEKVYINMDSAVLKSFLSKYRNPTVEQIQVAERKYYSSVFFHTLFLYTITKNRGYQFEKFTEGGDGKTESIDVGTYLMDVFDNYYTSFVLNFGGMEEIMQGVG
ncbi:hypothetical protein [Dyadobacter sp. 32]|uniref:hypothetical protein n=1 Tax=Dyadobacter sp. 32 TaxID=538966 RepID=UPI0039C5BDE3